MYTNITTYIYFSLNSIDRDDMIICNASENE